MVLAHALTFHRRSTAVHAEQKCDDGIRNHVIRSRANPLNRKVVFTDGFNIDRLHNLPMTRRRVVSATHEDTRQSHPHSPS